MEGDQQQELSKLIFCLKSDLANLTNLSKGVQMNAFVNYPISIVTNLNNKIK